MEENNSNNQIINQASNNQVNDTQAANNQQQSTQTNTQNTNNGFSIPKQYKPISAWGYVGWDILFSIPVVGLIILIVFACGGTSNINRKKYAQSKFCAFFLALLLSVISFLILYFVFGITFTPGKYRIVL